MEVGERPGVMLAPRVPVRQVQVVLTPEAGGRAVTLKSGTLTPGDQRPLEWSQPVGKARWAATGKVVWADGSQGEFGLTFETEVFPKITSSISKADVDLANRVLRIRLNQPAAKAEIRVTGDDGKPMYSAETELDTPAGESIELRWDQTEGLAVLKIELKLWSTFGFWVSLDITPFEVEIPHEDVVFSSGSWTVQPSESAKLARTLELVNEKVARYGGFLQLELYVAGYTDTVGSHGSNQELSEKRARAIGGWFKAHGLKLPVFYQGFGEDALSVKTPDETDRAENRRALYVLSASAPATQSSVPRNNWKRL